MTDYSQLVRYIERREKGGFGWKKDYDTEIAGNDYAYLSGHVISNDYSQCLRLP